MAPVPTVLMTRAEGRVLLVNDAFVRETGHGQADVVGRDAVALPLWTDPEAATRIEGRLRSDGRVRELDLRLRTQDGGALDCLVAADAVEINGQRCILFIAQNVTERSRTQLEVAAAIEAVMRRTSWFTDAVIEELARSRQADGPAPVDGGLGDMPARPREVLVLVCQGLDDATIGSMLGLSRNTVRNHVAGLYKRTGSRNRTALVVWARERGVGGASRTK